MKCHVAGENYTFACVKTFQPPPHGRSNEKHDARMNVNDIIENGSAI